MMREQRRGGLALVGFRGTGKSSVGRVLAGRLGLPFADADVVLETKLGVSIADLFKTHGEPYFREQEAATLRELTESPSPLVLATGGGVILRKANREALRRFGTVVWLTADPALLAERLAADPTNHRPALTPLGVIEEIEHLLEARAPLYREVADFTISTDDKTVQTVADEILAALAGASSA
jgi:shikimate kinase